MSVGLETSGIGAELQSLQSQMTLTHGDITPRSSSPLQPLSSKAKRTSSKALFNVLTCMRSALYYVHKMALDSLRYSTSACTSTPAHLSKPSLTKLSDSTRLAARVLLALPALPLAPSAWHTSPSALPSSCLPCKMWWHSTFMKAMMHASLSSLRSVQHLLLPEAV